MGLIIGNSESGWIYYVSDTYAKTYANVFTLFLLKIFYAFTMQLPPNLVQIRIWYRFEWFRTPYIEGHSDIENPIVPGTYLFTLIYPVYPY